MCAFSHFRSRDKDGSHTILSNVAINPMLHANIYVFYNRSYCRSKFYIAGISIFYIFCRCDLELDLMNRILEIYRMCNNQLHNSKLSKVIILHTDRHDWNYIRCCSTDGQKLSIQVTERTKWHQVVKCAVNTHSWLSALRGDDDDGNDEKAD